MTIGEKKKALIECLQTFDRLLVAFSGGVDSTFLLAVAQQVLKNRVIAVTASTPLHSDREIKEAKVIAKKLGVTHKVLSIDAIFDTKVAANSDDRCYHCKKYLFNHFLEFAHQEGIQYVVHGANRDDRNDYRPGNRAAIEMGILAPLDEAGLTKQEIRQLSKKMGLATWNKPAMACLATRIPYHTALTLDALAMVEKAENVLFNHGFSTCRVRHHGQIARIELAEEELPRVLDDAIRNNILTQLQAIGFVYITIDLKGYDQGSLNRSLVL